MGLLIRMLVIAVLVGVVVGGAVWYGWGAAQAAIAARSAQRRLAKDAADLLDTAEDAKSRDHR